MWQTVVSTFIEKLLSNFSYSFLTKHLEQQVRYQLVPPILVRVRHQLVAVLVVVRRRPALVLRPVRHQLVAVPVVVRHQVMLCFLHMQNS